MYIILSLAVTIENNGFSYIVKICCNFSPLNAIGAGDNLASAESEAEFRGEGEDAATLGGHIFAGLPLISLRPIFKQFAQVKESCYRSVDLFNGSL